MRQVAAATTKILFKNYIKAQRENIDNNNKKASSQSICMALKISPQQQQNNKNTRKFTQCANFESKTQTNKKKREREKKVIIMKLICQNIKSQDKIEKFECIKKEKKCMNKILAAYYYDIIMAAEIISWQFA